jgi:Domain of unknown function (DUF1835)
MDIHVVQGEGAAASIQQALGLQNESVVVLADPLSVGPLAKFSSVEAWAQMRLGFLRDVLLYDTATINELTIDLARLRSSTVTTVWLGTGPTDQIALAWLCALMRVIEIDTDGLRVVQFSPDFVDGHCLPALGFLGPKQVRQHPPLAALSRAELATLDDAWAAVTADTPDALVRFTRLSSGPLPILRQAFKQMLTRYPNVDTGLPRWDRILLRKVESHGPGGSAVMGHALLADGWDQDPVGDMWLYWRLRRLASPSLRYPLLELSGEPSDYRTVAVRLTDAGQAVARAEATAIALNGVDDIIGGVHLSSEANQVWATEKGNLIRLEQHHGPQSNSAV